MSAGGTQNLKTIKKKKGREKTLEEIVQELNFPELTVGDIKLKIKTTTTRYTAELAGVIKSERNNENKPLSCFSDSATKLLIQEKIEK